MGEKNQRKESIMSHQINKLVINGTFLSQWCKLFKYQDGLAERYPAQKVTLHKCVCNEWQPHLTLYVRESNSVAPTQFP